MLRETSKNLTKGFRTIRSLEPAALRHAVGLPEKVEKDKVNQLIRDMSAITGKLAASGD